jgi:hypothetical protein
LQQRGLGVVLVLVAGICAWQMTRELRREK